MNLQIKNSDQLKDLIEKIKSKTCTIDEFALFAMYLASGGKNEKGPSVENLPFYDELSWPQAFIVEREFAIFSNFDLEKNRKLLEKRIQERKQYKILPWNKKLRYTINKTYYKINYRHKKEGNL